MDEQVDGDNSLGECRARECLGCGDARQHEHHSAARASVCRRVRLVRWHLLDEGSSQQLAQFLALDTGGLQSRREARRGRDEARDELRVCGAALVAERAHRIHLHYEPLDLCVRLVAAAACDAICIGIGNSTRR